MDPNTQKLDDNDLLKIIADGTAAETGSRFFRALVKSLSQALGTYGAWVTEFIPEARRLRALAFWLGEDYVDHYEYELAGTPCEPTILNKTYSHIQDNVIELYPEDPDLPKMAAVSYMGYPLLDADNNVLGNLAVLDTKPMPKSLRDLALFRIFAARATAELLRIRADAKIRMREAKLAGLFNGAMDAIIELDHDFNITMMNPAAVRIFGCQHEHCLGKSFSRFLAAEDHARLRRIGRQLELRPKGNRNVWVSEGLMALDADKKKISAEATLSLIEVHDDPCFVVILRDVNERIEAQKKIESLRDETEYLRDEIQFIYNLGEIIGKSRPFRKTLQLVAEVAPADSTVLIYGETGTGKELIARAIHAASRRKDRALITVNCAAIPEALMESEFFGHEKGAFTGATQRREGRFSLADGGTIFLDEIGELNKELQAKLLRVLQEGEFTPVGSSMTHRIDVRVIAATNRDLSREVQDGHFRIDLFYRLNVFPINIPPLKQRGDDIGLLADHFVSKFSRRMARKIHPLSADCVGRLKSYDWPGNVRELQNVIERGVITARYGRLNLDFAFPEDQRPPEAAGPMAWNGFSADIKTAQEILQLERSNLLLALEKSQWRVAGEKGAARLLGMPPSTLQSKMKALNIKRPH